MKKITLTIKINKPVSEVFEFLLNPKNTPLWIPSIVKEETNEWPVKVGSIYRNHGADNVWSSYRVTQLEPNKSFELLKDDNNYRVHYTFQELEKNITEFVYEEWVENGELTDPFTQEILEKLKTILEKMNIMQNESTQHPRVGVGILVVREMKVLMGKRKGSFGAGTWAFPGGHLEWNEEVGDCAKREVKEETGLELTRLQYGPYTNDILKEENKHYITVLVIAHCDIGEPQLLEPDKCEEWGWFEWNHLPEPLFLPTQNIVKLDFSPWRWSGIPVE